MSDAPGPRFTQRDAAVLAVITLVLTPVLIVAIRGTIEESRRARCADNLKAIGLALLFYSNENRGSVPRVRYQPATVVTPVWGTGAASSDPFAGPEPYDVTAAMFLLLRTGDLTPERFVCPTTDAVPDSFGGKRATDRANFTDPRKNLSYSMQNPYPNESAKLRVDRGTTSGEFAVFSDRNPGAVGDRDVTRVTATSSTARIRRANSANHGGDGQNVLYEDAHVGFQTTPFAGESRGFRSGLRDNIFTNFDGEVVASPTREFEDSLLLPTDD